MDSTWKSRFGYIVQLELELEDVTDRSFSSTVECEKSTPNMNIFAIFLFGFCFVPGIDNQMCML